MPQTRHNIGIESPGFNAMVVRNDDDGWKFLLLQRAGTETYSGTWGVITGRKLEGESMAQAVVREVNDETALTEVRMFATENLIQYLKDLSVAAYHPNESLCSVDLITTLQNSGIRVNAWTINNMNKAKEFLKHGVGVITDWPQLLTQ